MITDRRAFLGIAGLATAGVLLFGRTTGASAKVTFAVNHTPQQWQQILGAQRYHILREAGTERPFSSPLDHEKRAGVFACAGCKLALFSSTTKFDSGTGWPSFYKPLPNAVGQEDDTSLGMLRSEVHCGRCGGHLGHVFDDGPPPTGQRYCNNGVALRFIPKTA